MTSISNHSVLKEVTHVLILCTPRLEVELKKMGWQPLTGREGKGTFQFALRVLARAAVESRRSRVRPA